MQTLLAPHSLTSLPGLRAALGPSVRVQLDWDRALDLALPVSVRAHVGPAPGSWFTPWYVSAGLRCSHDSPGAVPLRVGEIASPTLDEVFWDDRLGDLVVEMVEETDPVHLVALTWGLPDGTTLVLDGNHRLVAAAVACVGVVLVELRVEGPADPALLPDLVHHLGAGSLPVQRSSP